MKFLGHLKVDIGYKYLQNSAIGRCIPNTLDNFSSQAQNWSND